MQMLMAMEVCSVSCQANTGFQVQILPTNIPLPPVNNHPTYCCNVGKFGVLSWTAPAAKKP